MFFLPSGNSTWRLNRATISPMMLGSQIALINKADNSLNLRAVASRVSDLVS